jgi:hypothetical protein
MLIVTVVILVQVLVLFRRSTSFIALVIMSTMALVFLFIAFTRFAVRVILLLVERFWVRLLLLSFFIVFLWLVHITSEFGYCLFFSVLKFLIVMVCNVVGVLLALPCGPLYVTLVDYNQAQELDELANIWGY